VCARLMCPRRLNRSAIVLKPSTRLSVHRALTTRKISPALLGQGANEARPERPEPGGHRRGRRDETAESDLGVSTYRATDRLGLRDSHRHRRGAPHSRRAVHLWRREVPAPERNWEFATHRHDVTSVSHVSRRGSALVRRRQSRRRCVWTLDELVDLFGHT
jgi:hypothetical protein